MENTGFKKKILRMADIHETAVIHPEARIARDVKIGPYTIIGENVEIGKGTEIGPHVVIEGRTMIGSKNRIYHGAVVGTFSQELQELQKSGQDRELGPDRGKEIGSVFIGDNNIIRENVTIYRGSKGTRLGNNNFIMAYCHLASDCQVGNDIIMSNAANLSAKVVVEDQAVVAGLSVIHEGVRIGKMAMLGGHSRLTKDIPPYMLVDGLPARVKGINVIGLRRNGFSPAVRRDIKQAYKILYRSNLNLEEAIKKMEQELKSGEEIEHFLGFLRNVQRGICIG